jgi:hypothetical protein
MAQAYNSITHKANFTVNSDTVSVCPHCQSGFVIITVGVHNHEVERMALCILKEVKRALYCPYCGKDMTEMFRWEKTTGKEV